MMSSRVRGKQGLSFAMALAATGLAVTGALAANNRICIDAENATSMETPLKKVLPGVNKQYSGKGFLEIPWDKNETKGIGQAGYRINVKTAGTYTLWARTYWMNGCGNSIAVSVNGGPVAIIGEDGTYDKWHWPESTVRVRLKAGVNTLVLKNRETGVRVDQFFLSQDPDYTPTGIRKATQ
jgi:hypothetical protein